MAPKACPATHGGARKGAGKKPANPEGSTQQSRCTGFDFRQWIEHTGEDPYEFWLKIKPHVRTATWQLERSPQNGLLHWQGRCRLWKKVRPGSAELTAIAQAMMGHHGWWMGPTIKEEFESGMARYMAKCATRVAGPWNDRL